MLYFQEFLDCFLRFLYPIGMCITSRTRTYYVHFERFRRQTALQPTQALPTTHIRSSMTTPIPRKRKSALSGIDTPGVGWQTRSRSRYARSSEKVGQVSGMI